MSPSDLKYVVDASDLAAYWQNMLFALYATSTGLLSYGLYMVLFILSLRCFLRRQNPGEKRLVLVGTTYVMFVLGTTQMVLSLCMTGVSVRMVQALVEQDAVDGLARLWRVYFNIDVAQNIIFVVNNCVTDLLFLYRCYIIWGSRLAVIAAPALCVLSTVVLGVLATVSYDSQTQAHYIDRRAPFIVNVATNALLVCLTAGRIWWVERRARGLIGAGIPRPARYATVIAMILESGSIYCFCLILQVVNQSLVPSNTSMIFLGLSTGLGQQVVNIAPALIGVRVGGGSEHEHDDDQRRRNTSQIVFHQNTPLSILSSRNSRPDIEIKRSNLEAEVSETP